MKALHVPVLCGEAVGHLACGNLAGNFVDATFGGGGHSRLLLQRLAPGARLLALDQDAAAHQCAQALAEADERIIPRRGRFGDIAEVLAEADFAEVQGALMDVGLSSDQLDDPERGFSYRADGPLDMRMDQRRETAASAWLNEAPAGEIAHVLRRYGEEPQARRISRAIAAARPLATAQQLVRAIDAGRPRPRRGGHGARRVFQAVRIFINEELTQLQAGLEGLFNALAVGGRLAVISFHSLEDRIVKRFFRMCAAPPPAPRHVPLRAGERKTAARVIAGPVRPGANELARNPRARSAVLRVLERTR